MTNRSFPDGSSEKQPIPTAYILLSGPAATYWNCGVKVVTFANGIPPRMRYPWWNPPVSQPKPSDVASPSAGADDSHRPATQIFPSGASAIEFAYSLWPVDPNVIDPFLFRLPASST